MTYIIGIGVLVVIQFWFAFACVRILKQKNRLNNWWVLFAAFVPIIPYIIANKITDNSKIKE